MHILYLHQHFATNKGSTGTRSYDFARRWVSKGHRVTVITGFYAPGGLEPPQRLIEHRNVDGIDVVILNIKYDNRMSYSRRILSFLSFMVLACYVSATLPKYDVAFPTSTPLTIAIPGIIARVRRRCPMVFEVRDLWPEFAVAYGALRNPVLIGLARALERLTYRLSAHIVSISPYMSRRLVQYGVSPEKVSTIPIGTDTVLFNSECDGTAFRRAYKLDLAFVCLYTGTISTVNALERVVDVAACLRDEPRIQFVFIGDGKLVLPMTERVRQLGLKNVLILPPVPRDQLPGIIAAADVTIISGQPHEHAKAIFPNKLFDYLASGKPVLVNFDSATADLLREADCGIVLTHHSARQIAEALQELAADRRRLMAMGRRARNVAIERFDRTQLADRLLEILTSVAMKRPVLAEKG